jgi:type II secretory pathway component PulF
VVKYRERHELLGKRVRGGMLYPAILLIACFAVILFISKFVMPEFQDMFSKFSDEQLPALTRAFMASTNFIGQWWWVGILIVLGAILAYDLWWVKSPGRRLAADRIKLKLPILGSILRKNAIVEMTQTLSLLLRSGLPMMVTLDLVRNAIHNRAAAQVVQQMRDSVERGEGLEKSLRANEDIIPSVVTDMMVTGEESGRLDTICEQISETMEEEVNIALGTLGEALQPVLTVLIGVLVVLLMLAVFVPLVGMLDTLSTAGV